MTTHIVKTPSGMEFHVDAPSHLSDEDIIGHVHNTVNGLPTQDKGVMLAGNYLTPGGLIMTPQEQAMQNGGGYQAQPTPTYTQPQGSISYEEQQRLTREHNAQIEQERQQRAEQEKSSVSQYKRGRGVYGD